MKITSTVIITTINAASIAKKMESPIARPTEVDTVEDGSVLNAVCVCGGGGGGRVLYGTIILCGAYTIQTMQFLVKKDFGG